MKKFLVLVLFSVFLAFAVGCAKRADETPDESRPKAPETPVVLELEHEGVGDEEFERGLYYEYGVDVEKNVEEAVKYYRLAADKGNSNAYLKLGLCYANGIGVERNEVEAARFFRLCAEKGNPLGQLELGSILERNRRRTKRSRSGAVVSTLRRTRERRRTV